MSRSQPACSPRRRPSAPPLWRAFERRHRFAAGVAAACTAVGIGCYEINDPYPHTLPPNLAIASIPPRGALVDVTPNATVSLLFDQPMESGSVQHVQRLSFLLPLAVGNFDGRWNDDATRVDFELDQFPLQPGTTYEARFIGLRRADGELYNGGPFEVRFRTRGTPDLFPMRPHPRVATRVMCRRTDGLGDCGAATLHFDSTGTDTLRMRSNCEDCAGARLDWFRSGAGRIEWLGWDDVDPNDVVLRNVRWPRPLPFLATRTAPGTTFDAEPQTASDGTELVHWRALHAGTESPTAVVEIHGQRIEVVYSASATVDFDYTLRDVDGSLEHRHERWWLYAGVGLVKRDVRIESDGMPPERFVETLAPSLINFTR